MVAGMTETPLSGQVRRQPAVRWRLRQNGMLYALLVPAVVTTVIFMYIPMYGIIIAFQDYQPIYGFHGSRFVGLDWFRLIFQSPDFKQILWNTIIIATMKIIMGQIVPLTFALLLNEVRQMLFKRTVQTLVYFPHFLSWVIAAGIFMEILSTEGIVNRILHTLGGERIFFLGSNDWFRFTLVATDVWKGFGWGAILYLAALTGINPELYESAALDGAGRWKQTLHVTIPGIMPTIVLLATLSLGGVLDAGFEQVLMLMNPAVYQTGDIIDTFVYRAGLQEAQFSLATAVGLFKSAIGFLLIIFSYRLAYKFANYRIF